MPAANKTKQNKGVRIRHGPCTLDRGRRERLTDPCLYSMRHRDRQRSKPNCDRERMRYGMEAYKGTKLKHEYKGEGAGFIALLR